jgi:uncharacterized protein (TIGR02391 family)
MKRVEPFRSEDLEAIARILGDTQTGLTGSEIAMTLEECSLADVSPGETKWKRLYNALAMEQNRTQLGNHVIAFAHKAMKPVKWLNARPAYEAKRSELNQALAFSGLVLSEEGKLHRTSSVLTLREAQGRACGLRDKLEARGVHPDVLEFCKAELVQENYFHAVLEATKSVASKIRAQTGLTADGADLATQACAFGKAGKPLLAINRLSNDTELGEQRGFTNLLIGLFGTFRNPTAHAEKIYWPLGEQDALDILSLVSLVHRKLDAATKA